MHINGVDVVDARPKARNEVGIKETRLALVCYGGVSLAIYMHGMTKELQKLIVASAAYDRDDATNPFSVGSSEHAWWNFLDSERSNGVRRRVVVDIVSGTSAGGINGIFLAKALATNRSQDVLTDIWLGKGDFDLLLRGPKWTPVKIRAALYGLNLATRPTRAPAPLFGDRMSQWLIEGLEAMESSPAALDGVTSLVPAGQSIDLFVPITDYSGRARELPIQSPKWLHDYSHRHVMAFRHDDLGTQLDSSGNGMLGFAARATSSFPGGFPPISLSAFRDAVRDVPTASPLVFDVQHHFPLYMLADENLDDRWFVDGGVLDNAPFGSSIDAIRTKPAATEVDRRLLYVEPDPAAATKADSGGIIPNMPKTVWAGLAAIPRQEPIIDDLLRLLQRNEDVMRVRDVIESSFSTISDRVRSLVGIDGSIRGDLTVSDVDKLIAHAREAALQDAGMAVTTYARLRIRSVVDDFARHLSALAHFPAGSFHADFVQDLLREWAAQTGVLDQAPSVTENQLSFIDDFDLAYYDRQVRFTISALSWWYRGGEHAPARSALDSGKALLYERLKEVHLIFRQLQQLPAVQDVVANVLDKLFVRTAFDEQRAITDIIEQNRERLSEMEAQARTHLADALPAWRQRVHENILSLTAEWGEAERDDLLVRYIGFPFWDVLTFPVQALSGVNERDSVEVARLSPRDVNLLDRAVDRVKLAGVGFHHFGAFFGRAERENDYLWGRLDAVERLVAIVTDDPAYPSLSEPNAKTCATLFAAVLGEERERLGAIRPLIARLDTTISTL